jgi:hypothetical protein
MLRRVSFGLLLLSSACTRVPADVSSPGTASASTPADGPYAEAEPIPGECKDAELTTCANSCSDAACLEWCAGESCVTTIASLLECMDEAEQRFAREHSAPEMEYETFTDEYGETYNQPTAESLERQYEWENAHEGALADRWADACLPICQQRLSPNGEGESFCGDWRSSYYAWTHLSEPPPERAAGLLGMAQLSGLGMLGMLSLGTAIWLDGELAQRYDDPHAAALMQMVSRAGGQLEQAESCVPDLDAEGREFAIAVELDPNGAVVAAHARDDSSSTGECVAGVLASALTLPLRLARDYPQLEVRVLVRPVPNFGGLSGFGDDGSWDAYGEMMGDDYGYGGLGTSGMGAGGGGEDGGYNDGYGTVGSGGGGGGYGVGSGYGRGGGGTADIDLEPPPEPADEQD